MKKSYQLSLPGEKIIEQNTADCKGGSDELIKKLLEKKMTGFLRLEAEPLLGFAIFKNGSLEEGFFLNGNKIVSSSVNAMMDFRKICEKGGIAVTAELPAHLLRFAKIMHVGTNILPVTSADTNTFNSIYKEFKDKIVNGLLLVNSADGKAAVVNIAEGKWKLQMNKEEFSGILAQEGTEMALFDYDEKSIKERIAEATETEAAETAPEGDRNELIRQKLFEFIEANYKDQGQKLREKLEAMEITEETLPGVYSEIEEFVKFFIDDENIQQKITVLKEVINHLD